jgi:hypothetical protein
VRSSVVRFGSEAMCGALADVRLGILFSHLVGTKLVRRGDEFRF